MPGGFPPQPAEFRRQARENLRSYRRTMGNIAAKSKRGPRSPRCKNPLQLEGRPLAGNIRAVEPSVIENGAALGKENPRAKAKAAHAHDRQWKRRRLKQIQEPADVGGRLCPRRELEDVRPFIAGPRREIAEFSGRRGFLEVMERRDHPGVPAPGGADGRGKRREGPEFDIHGPGRREQGGKNGVPFRWGQLPPPSLQRMPDGQNPREPGGRDPPRRRQAVGPPLEVIHSLRGEFQGRGERRRGVHNPDHG